MTASSAITLRWLQGHLMVASDSNGHSVVIGREPEPPYNWVGVRPAELLLMAAAACATWDVTDILEKMRQDVQDLKVITSGEQLEEPPYSFTHIHLHYQVYGPVDPAKVERAIQISQDKYCSVICTLRGGVPVTSDFEIFNGEGAE